MIPEEKKSVKLSVDVWKLLKHASTETGEGIQQLVEAAILQRFGPDSIKPTTKSADSYPYPPENRKAHKTLEELLADPKEGARTLTMLSWGLDRVREKSKQ